MDDVIGGFLGFFFGCCGIVLCVLLGGGKYSRGALVGFGLRFVIGAGMTALSSLSSGTGVVHPDGTPKGLLEGVPWELAVILAIVIVFFVGLVAGAVWAFGPRDDDDDDAPPRSEPDYVTVDRR